MAGWLYTVCFTWLALTGWLGAELLGVEPFRGDTVSFRFFYFGSLVGLGFLGGLRAAISWL